jgi:hypothetical protein
MGSARAVIPLPSTARIKRGRMKKSMRKPPPYHPYLSGSKLQMLYDCSKGGGAARRKGGVRGVSSCSTTNSNESDPIVNSQREGLEFSGQQVHDNDGIQLEVVLPNSTVAIATSNEGLVVGSGQGEGGNGSSGLAGMLGEQGISNNGDLVSDWMVEKERGDAHHIIDIQEDLGVTFRGVVEENVERCVKMEQRDRRLKNDWEQSNGF